MILGVPREVKTHEYRVGLTPASVREAVAHGHEVLVQCGAGHGIGASDEDYRLAGARVVDGAADVFSNAQLVVKVKEPQARERAMLRPGQVLFTYLHLAPDLAQAHDLLASGCIAIAYETVTSKEGTLPLLTPMSEVAGRLAVQVAARYLEAPQGGPGILVSGVAGVLPAKVLILGAGVAGSNAARIAAAMGAEVVVLNIDVNPLRRLESELGAHVRTEASSRSAIEKHLGDADVVIGAALVPGGLAPKLVTRADLSRMRKGAVLVDVSIDQGGCFETSRPTTHADPVFVVDGITHYCVANMPGAVPRTSTLALNNATLPFVLCLADQGWQAALAADPHLRNGLNICKGKVTHASVAHALGLEWVDPAAAIAG
ncbi:MAG: alanine dehydrogenase [Burkholderiales bacterium]